MNATVLPPRAPINGHPRGEPMVAHNGACNDLAVAVRWAYIGHRHGSAIAGSSAMAMAWRYHAVTMVEAGYDRGSTF